MYNSVFCSKSGVPARGPDCHTSTCTGKSSVVPAWLPLDLSVLVLSGRCRHSRVRVRVRQGQGLAGIRKCSLLPLPLEE